MIDAACARAEERARVLSVVVFLVAALLGFGFIPLLAGTGTGVREYVTFEIATVFGSAAAFAFFPALVQSVSIGETAARERARRVSAQGAVIVASTLIGAGVRLLFGG